MVVYDRNNRACCTTVDALVCLWKALEKACGGISLGSEHVYMPFVCYGHEVEYAD